MRQPRGQSRHRLGVGYLYAPGYIGNWSCMGHCQVAEAPEGEQEQYRLGGEEPFIGCCFIRLGDHRSGAHFLRLLYGRPCATGGLGSLAHVGCAGLGHRAVPCCGLLRLRGLVVRGPSLATWPEGEVGM